MLDRPTWAESRLGWVVLLVNVSKKLAVAAVSFLHSHFIRSQVDEIRAVNCAVGIISVRGMQVYW